MIQFIIFRNISDVAEMDSLLYTGSIKTDMLDEFDPKQHKITAIRKTV